MKKGIAVNPFLPEWEYIPDGEPHVFDGRVWLYGSHDRAAGSGYCLEDYAVWSASEEDLSDWRYEGISYRKTDDPYNENGKKLLLAPDVARGKDGRYYLYYFLSDMKRISVALSDVPRGPFRYLGDVRYPDGSLLDKTVAFDPAILSDDSGNWLYYGFCLARPSLRMPGIEKKGGFCVRLEDDMLTIKDEPKEVLPGAAAAAGTEFEGHGFLEASSIRHIGDEFYLIYSSEQGHELCYAVSDRPDGGFRYGGVIISNADAGYEGSAPKNYMANNHGGLVCIKNQWYIFYHRHTHKEQYSRQACAEKIEILPNGRIPQVEMTSCGLHQGHLPALGRYPAYIACGLKGPQGVLHLSSSVKRRTSDLYFKETEKCLYLTNMQDGASALVRYLEFTGEENRIFVTCRGSFTGEIRLCEETSGELLSVIPVSCAEGEGGFVEYSAALRRRKGTISLVFHVCGQGMLECKEFACTR